MSQKRFAFVLRLWNETTTKTTSGSLELRGSLQLANSEQIVYFNSLEQIPEILREMTGWQKTVESDENHIGGHV